LPRHSGGATPTASVFVGENNSEGQLQKMSPERLKALNEWIEQNGKGV